MRVFHFVLTAALTLALASTAAAQTATATESHWLASAFAGTSFGGEVDEASPDFGGTVGYLWRGILGGEFQANLSPEFNLSDSKGAVLFGEEPWLNSYMANIIGAIPLGTGGQWRPYVSGGLGVFTLRSDVIITDGEQNDVTPDDTRFAGNVGLGMLGFVGATGFRADMRYFNHVGNTDVVADDTPAEVMGKQLLGGLGFWRATGGVAFRF